jgi:hypothetical protein
LVEKSRKKEIILGSKKFEKTFYEKLLLGTANKKDHRTLDGLPRSPFNKLKEVFGMSTMVVLCSFHCESFVAEEESFKDEQWLGQQRKLRQGWVEQQSRCGCV